MTIDQFVYGYVANEETYSDKAGIIEEGGKGDWVYVILEGRAKVRRKTQKGVVTLDTFKEGDIFGEMVLLTTGQELPFEQDVDCVTLRGLPADPRTDLFPVIRLECVAPPVARLAPFQRIDKSGSISRPLARNRRGRPLPLVAGETWCFQLAYFDLRRRGRRMLSFSDGLRVTFTP